MLRNPLCAASLQKGDLAVQLPLLLCALPPPLQTSYTPNAPTFLPSFIPLCLRKPSPFSMNQKLTHPSRLTSNKGCLLWGAFPDSLGRDSQSLAFLCASAPLFSVIFHAISKSISCYIVMICLYKSILH